MSVNLEPEVALVQRAADLVRENASEPSRAPSVHPNPLGVAGAID